MKTLPRASKIPCFQLALLWLFECLSLNIALASQDQNYGMGGVTSGRVSGVTADISNSFAALYNPALVAAQTQTNFSLNSTVTGAFYDPLPSVLVDHPKYRTQTGEEQRGSGVVQPIQSVLWSVGLVHPFTLRWPMQRRAGLGFVLSGPFGSLRSFDSATPYDFQSFRYGTSDNQFKATLGSGIELVPGSLYFGAGLSVYVAAAGSVEAVVVGANPTGRWKQEITWNSALIAGLFASTAPVRSSLVLRQAIDPTFRYRFVGQAEPLGAGRLTLPFELQTSLYYEPQVIESDVEFEVGQGLIVSMGMGYQFWSSYKPSYLQLATTDNAGGKRNSELPALDLHNTWNPRISVDVPVFAATHLAAGYQYRPSPVQDLSGTGNFLDSDTHLLGVSVRYRLPRAWFAKPVELGVFGQYHLFEPRAVVKENPNSIGSPGYDLGGHAESYGLSIQATL